MCLVWLRVDMFSCNVFFIIILIDGGVVGIGIFLAGMPAFTKYRGQISNSFLVTEGE